MTGMWQCAAVFFFAASGFGQTKAEAELLRAARSPYDLAKYAESHGEIDWSPLWAAWKVKDSEYLNPCRHCQSEILTVRKPDQAILILYDGGPQYHDLYVRYLKEPDGSWKFSGVQLVYIRETTNDRPHKVLRLWAKPFLMVSRDQSQIGFATIQEREDWFDLTLPDFEPVFSFTPQGSYELFSFAVWREWDSTAAPNVEGAAETIWLTIKAKYEGPTTMEFLVTYTGLYQRRAGQKAFSLKSATANGRPMRVAEFEVIGDAFKMTQEQLLVQSLPGLRKLAVSKDADGKEWLQTVLEQAKDTPEKRELLGLLGKK